MVNSLQTMSNGFSLLDIVFANQSVEFISSELRKLVLEYGSLERNLLLHNKLLNDIPKYYPVSIGNYKTNSSVFDLLIKKIQEIESRIDKYISLMLESEIELPELATTYIRLKDLLNHYKKKEETNQEIPPLTDLEKENQSLNNIISIQNNKIKKFKKRDKFKLGNLTNTQIETIADDCRKMNGTINYAKMGRKVGRDPNTIKNEIERRGLSYLKTAPS